MRGWWLLGGVLGAGCGRWGFDPSDATDAPPGTPDAALPGLICNRAGIAIEGVPADADLAITGMGGDGFAAAFTSTAGSDARALQIDSGFHAVGEIRSFATDTLAIGGVVDTGSYLMVAITDTGNPETAIRIERDLSVVMPIFSDVAVLGREPFAAEQTGLTRAWLRGTTAGVVMSYVHADGAIDPSGLYPTQNPVTAIAGDDGPDHAHLVWREGAGADLHTCIASDIDFTQSDHPIMGSQQMITTDCAEVRNASGPPAADSMIIVWRTLTGQVIAKYIASTGDVDTALSLAGRAPKVRFDGQRFWVAWIDAAAGGVIELAKLELDGTLTAAPLPERVPNGDEAFELVRNAGTVYLAILRPGLLELLEPCQS